LNLPREYASLITLALLGTVLYPSVAIAHRARSSAKCGAMNDIRYAEHVNATAVCVELALSGVEADLEKELEASTGRAAEALRRVLDRLRQRRETVAELTKQVH